MENQLAEDQKYMQMALDLAVKAQGRTSPNPLVGAVVVFGGCIVGRGYHQKSGLAHAEVNALTDAGEKAQGATIYVTLEPCNHYGRTGPCTQAIIKSGIRRVVVGMSDPNLSVDGGGNDFLVQQGVDLSCGILEDECKKINRPFIKWVTKGTPWVIVKAGISLDGRIASAKNEQLWITNEESRAYVHQIRDQVDAILIGVGTALADDPSLTARIEGKFADDPIRVVLDTHLRLDPTAKLLHQKSDSKTIIYCGDHVTQDQQALFLISNVDIEAVSLGRDGQIDLEMVLESLAKKQITSILVEGGSQVHASFIQNAIADQAMFFYGPVFIGDNGVPLLGNCDAEADKIFPHLTQVVTRQFGNDVLIEGLFE